MATRYEILAEELVIDPLGRGYSGMTDAQAADDINTNMRQVNLPYPIANLELQIRESLKWTGYQEKASQQNTPGTYDFSSMKEFMDLFFTTTSTGAGGGEIDVQGTYMTGLIDRMEAEGSMGAVAAQALRESGIQTVSRGTEIGVGQVTEGDVNYARTLPVDIPGRRR